MRKPHLGTYRVSAPRIGNADQRHVLINVDTDDDLNFRVTYEFGTNNGKAGSKYTEQLTSGLKDVMPKKLEEYRRDIASYIGPGRKANKRP